MPLPLDSVVVTDDTQKFFTGLGELLKQQHESGKGTIYLTQKKGGLST